MGDGKVMEEGTRAHHPASRQEQGWKLTQAARTLLSDPDTRMARHTVTDPWHTAPRPSAGQQVREPCGYSLTPQHPQATATCCPTPRPGCALSLSWQVAGQQEVAGRERWEGQSFRLRGRRLCGLWAAQGPLCLVVSQPPSY